LPPPAPPSPCSLHDALPIFGSACGGGSDHKGDNAAAKSPQNVEQGPATGAAQSATPGDDANAANNPAAAPQAAAGTNAGPSAAPDRKSTRLNSSHLGISYAV